MGGISIKVYIFWTGTPPAFNRLTQCPFSPRGIDVIVAIVGVFCISHPEIGRAPVSSTYYKDVVICKSWGTRVLTTGVFFQRGDDGEYKRWLMEHGKKMLTLMDACCDVLRDGLLSVRCSSARGNRFVVNRLKKSHNVFLMEPFWMPLR